LRLRVASRLTRLRHSPTAFCTRGPELRGVDNLAQWAAPELSQEGRDALVQGRA
jgi:hypothetical protein